MIIKVEKSTLLFAVFVGMAQLGGPSGCVAKILDGEPGSPADSGLAGDKRPEGDHAPSDAASDLRAPADGELPDVTVSVLPEAPIVPASGTLQLSATVAGSVNTEVIWSVDEPQDCGSISDDGLYTAPAVAGTCHVTATSVANPTRSATVAAKIRVFHYISPTGDDTDGDGSLSNPWASLYHATVMVTVPGSLIFVLPGRYVETQQCKLAVGVSVMGEGDTSHIVSHFQTVSYTGGFLSLAEPLAEGIDGNQSISHLKLDGELIGTIAVFVLGRSNVKIHNLTVVDFAESGIGFKGAYPGPMPGVFATGNEIHHCHIENSSTRGTVSCGLIRSSGQEGMLIHDNVLIQNQRVPGENGNIFNAWGGLEKGMKYYNNVSYKPPTDGIVQPSGKGWNFHIEAGGTFGGMEVHHNEFHGGVAIDIAHVSNVKGDYDYSWWVHDNTFMLDEKLASIADGMHTPGGVEFEGTNEDAIVNNNHFVNLPMGVSLDIGQDVRHDRNIRVFYNIFENMGFVDGDWAFIMSLNAYKSDNLIEEIHFTNNVIRGTARGAFFVTTADRIRNVYIRNNIIEEIVVYGWLTFWDGPGTIDGIYVQNNIIFDNVNDNAIYYRNGKSVTNLVGYDFDGDMGGNLNLDPFFVSDTDFHLQPGSPGLNAGQDVNLDFDFEYTPVDDSPNIGAFE